MIPLEIAKLAEQLYIHAENCNGGRADFDQLPDEAQQHYVNMAWNIKSALKKEGVSLVVSFGDDSE